MAIASNWSVDVSADRAGVRTSHRVQVVAASRADALDRAADRLFPGRSWAWRGGVIYNYGETAESGEFLGSGRFRSDGLRLAFDARPIDCLPYC